MSLSGQGKSGKMEQRMGGFAWASSKGSVRELWVTLGTQHWASGKITHLYRARWISGYGESAIGGLV